MKPTRRQFMATGAVVGTGALAGCSLSQIPFIGGGGGLGQYANWIPAKGTLAPKSDGNQNNQQQRQQGPAVSFFATSPSQVNSKRSNFHPNYYRSLQQSFSKTGLAWKNLKMQLSIGNGAVYSGSFNTDEVTNELTDDSGQSLKYTQDGSHKGYDIYVQSKSAVQKSTGISKSQASTDISPDAYGVGNGKVVMGKRIGFSEFGENGPSADITAADAVKKIIDVGKSGTNRATKSSDDFSTLTSNLNTGTLLSGRLRRSEIGSDVAKAETGRFEGLIAEGTSLSVNGKNTKRQEVYVFSSSGDADKGAAQDYLEAQDTGGGSWQYYRNTSVSTSNNVVTITGTIDTYDLGRSGGRRQQR